MVTVSAPASVVAWAVPNPAAPTAAAAASPVAIARRRRRTVGAVLVIWWFPLGGAGWWWSDGWRRGGGCVGRCRCGPAGRPVLDVVACHGDPHGAVRRQAAVDHRRAGDEDLAVDDADAGVTEVDQADDVAAPEHQDVRRARQPCQRCVAAEALAAQGDRRAVEREHRRRIGSLALGGERRPRSPAGAATARRSRRRTEPERWRVARPRQRHPAAVAPGVDAARLEVHRILDAVGGQVLDLGQAELVTLVHVERCRAGRR